MMSTRLPLSDVSVLDLTRARAGPTAVRQLADWGADVITIEAPAEATSAEDATGPRRLPGNTPRKCWRVWIATLAP